MERIEKAFDTDDFAGIDMHADILKNLQITERFLDSVHL
jgi:hypothetical protein